MADQFPVNNVVYVTVTFVAFAFVHSVCVSETVKKLISSLMGEMFVRGTYRFLFTVFSVVTLVIFAYLVRAIPDHDIVLMNGVPRMIFHLFQLAGLVVGVLAFRNIKTGDFLGLSQLLAYMRYGTVSGDIEGMRDNRLIVSGIYGVVRHPLYLGGILLFTFNPYITVNTLVVSILADLYFVFGAFIEEKRLIRRFGDEYIDYMNKVPRLVPSVRQIGKGDQSSGQG